jgi:hypothetical protein
MKLVSGNVICRVKTFVMVCLRLQLTNFKVSAQGTHFENACFKLEFGLQFSTLIFISKCCIIINLDFTWEYNSFLTI